MNKQVFIGPNKHLGKNVQVGVSSGRKISNLKLIVGRDAHLRSGTVIYLGSKIGNGLETGHNAIIREENIIGDHFSLWSNSIVDYGCTVGNDVKIHCNCYVAQFTIIEDGVFMAPGVTIANDLHPGTPDALQCMKGPTLKKGVQIGCNSTILPRVIIGESSLIGAGSVVTKDVPPFSIVYGNPARVIKKITDFRCKIDDQWSYRFLMNGLEKGKVL